MNTQNTQSTQSILTPEQARHKLCTKIYTESLTCTRADIDKVISAFDFMMSLIDKGYSIAHIETNYPLKYLLVSLTVKNMNPDIKRVTKSSISTCAARLRAWRHKAREVLADNEKYSTY